MGKLIVLEGTDGSGKATQTRRLLERLEAEGIRCRTVEFPRYKEESSALIRMYLGGEFGDRPSDVNAYAASTFYAVDRYASFKQDWGGFYEDGGVVLADRYTTSNAVHQGGKLAPGEREEYFRWLFDFEYRLMGLPAPDLVIYLDVPVEQTEENMQRREAETNTSADIHERDTEYLRQCRTAAMAAAEQFGWRRIPCVRDGVMRSIEEIHNEVYSAVKEIL
ncbi:MAG: thymidylate kinase [Oscillospiraceae bacterium]|nr:thymidylate kinase [Oscillospiraceae bacterium]